MTPEQERAEVDGAVREIEGDLRTAQTRLVQLILAGEEPRAAVAQVMETFTGEFDATVRAALLAIISASVGSASDVAIIVGTISLSASLYTEALEVGEVVRGIVQRQARGFLDAKALARELFEGYGFREPGAEPLKVSPTNEQLPQYLRDALQADPGLAGEMQRAFARLQVDGLSTPALRAAYSELLDAIDRMEAGAGAKMLERKLEVAFFERMRYFATRIARTELHRSYAEREARLILEDEAIEFVQVRRAPGRNDPCICSLFTGRDLYGLGPGVYPKREAPLSPFHPFCMCVMSPRLDLTGAEAKPRDDDGDAYFLKRLGERTAGRVMGSQAKADEVLSGARTAEEVANGSRNPAYRVRRVGEVG